jgi:cell division protease FtsH
MTDVDQGNVQEVTMDGRRCAASCERWLDLPHHGSANYPDMIKNCCAIRAKGINVRDANSGSWPLQLLGIWAPLILLGALWFFMIRQMQTGGNKALSFGKSRARLLSMQQKKSRSKTWRAWKKPRKS